MCASNPATRRSIRPRPRAADRERTGVSEYPERNSGLPRFRFSVRRGSFRRCDAHQNWPSSLSRSVGAPGLANASGPSPAPSGISQHPFRRYMGSVARRTGGARLTGRAPGVSQPGGSRSVSRPGGSQCVPSPAGPVPCPGPGGPDVCPSPAGPVPCPGPGGPNMCPGPGAQSRVPASPDFPVHNPGRSEVRPGPLSYRRTGCAALGSPMIRRSASGRERAHQSIGNRMAAFRVIG